MVTISLPAAGSSSTQQSFGGLGAPRASPRGLSSPQAAAGEHLTLLPSGDQLLPHSASALLDVSSLKNSAGWQLWPALAGRGDDLGCRSLAQVDNSPPVPIPGQSTAEPAAAPPAPQQAGQQGHRFYVLLIRKQSCLVKLYHPQQMNPRSGGAELHGTAAA